MSRAEAWRTNNELYQQSTIQVEPAVQRREPRDLYRSVDQMFDQCMVAQGYKLVPREQ